MSAWERGATRVFANGTLVFQSGVRRNGPLPRLIGESVPVETDDEKPKLGRPGKAGIDRRGAYVNEHGQGFRVVSALNPVKDWLSAEQLCRWFEGVEYADVLSWARRGWVDTCVLENSRVERFRLMDIPRVKASARKIKERAR